MAFLRSAVGYVATGFGILEKVLEANIYVISKIIGAIVRLIGKIREAIAWLGTLNLRAGQAGHDPIGDFIFGHAAGGWVGLHGPELVRVGEKGSEYIIPHDKLGQMTGRPRGSGGAHGPTGSGSPTIVFNYSPAYSSASLSEAQAFSRHVIPELVRELRRQHKL